MKKLLTLLALFAVILTSCTGDPGPPGRDGIDGINAEKPIVYEYDADYDYIADGNFWVSQIFNFTGSQPGDIYLAYISLNRDGIYTNMPASIFDDLGEFQYVFDHDFDTVEMQIIGDSDLSGLDNASTQGVWVRIAVIPADLVAQFNGDFSNLNAVMNALELQEADVKKLN